MDRLEELYQEIYVMWRNERDGIEKRALNRVMHLMEDEYGVDRLHALMGGEIIARS